MKNKIKFYDTCALLQISDNLYESGEHFVLSSITLKELERIKTSANKSPDIKYSARLLLKLFKDNPNVWTIVLHKIENEKPLIKIGFEITDDLRILSDAIWYRENTQNEVEFITDDLILKNIANSYFEGFITSTTKNTDTYQGYKELIPDENTLTKFYQNPKENIFNLLSNEYLILRDANNKIIDVRLWTGSEYRYLKSSPFVSDWFGKVLPYNKDIYQQLYCDSLSNNIITMVCGPAGSGKTYLAIAYLMSQIAKGRIDKIIIFCNTVATIDSAKLGYYPGSKDEKLLDSQIGNLLMSKLGGREGVKQLMDRGYLQLLPFSDIRGFDSTGMNAGIYITDAQNLSSTLLKLALQRIGEDCICIVDGDNNQQVDSKAFDGVNNGMRALSKAFRGENIYGEIKLKNIYRSRIASIAERIKII